MKSPKNGWVQELVDAQSAAKRSRSAGAQLRLAIAAYDLRLFKKMKASANLGLALDPNYSERKLLNECVENFKEQLQIRVDCDTLQKQRRPGVNCDVINISSDAVLFTNLNSLHYAVVTGNVTLMEEVVALGAALDFPVSDKNTPDISPASAPAGSTALILPCALLAVYGEMEHHNQTLRRTAPVGLSQMCFPTRLSWCQLSSQTPAPRLRAETLP